jgi:CBS domain containing-hemolysin-like protein
MMNDWIIVIICLIFSAFFSGMEIAFVSANKLRIELKGKQGGFSGKIFSYFIKDPAVFIGAMLVGNNISLVVYGITMAQLLDPFIGIYLDSEWIVLVTQTLIATALVLVTAEFIPKIIFRINPNKILEYLSGPSLLAYILLYPIVFVVIGISEFFLTRIFNIEIPKGGPAFGKVDLDNYLNESISSNEDGEVDPEIKIFQNALDFSKVKLRDCMVPRTEIIALSIDDNIQLLKDKFIETGLSKIVIYKNDIETIIGYVHSKEMFNKPNSIKNALLPVSIVPESMTANEMLKLFISQQRSMAVVVDEFGGTSGIVTIEDVMEEIFGEIEDEHDKLELLDKKLSDNEFILSGRAEIDYLNEKHQLSLPESEEYETLSGMITYHHESIPPINEGIQIENFFFKVTRVSETRIELVHMKITN